MGQSSLSLAVERNSIDQSIGTQPFKKLKTSNGRLLRTPPPVFSSPQAFATQIGSSLKRLTRSPSPDNRIKECAHSNLRTHDMQLFEKEKVKIQEELTLLKSFTIEPKQIDPLLKGILTTLTGLDEWVKAIRTKGSKEVINAIETYTKKVRNDPLLSSADHDLTKKLGSLHELGKQLILRPDFANDEVQDAFRNLHEELEATIQAIVLKAAMTQKMHFQAKNNRSDDPRANDVDLVKEQVKALENLCKGRSDLSSYGHILDEALAEEGFIVTDREAVSKAIEMIESEFLYRQEIEAFVRPEQMALQKLQHIKKTIESLCANRLLTLKGSAENRWIEAKATDFNLKMLPWKSEKLKEAIDFILNTLLSLCQDRRLHSLCKEIINLIKRNQGLSGCIKDSLPLEQKMQEITTQIDKKYASNRIEEQLRASEVIANQLSAHLYAHTFFNKDGTISKVEVKTLPQRRQESKALREHQTTIGTMIALFRQATSIDQREKALRILKKLNDIHYHNATFSVPIKELERQINELKGSKVIQPTQDKPLGFLNQLLDPPHNSRLQKAFLATYRTVINDLYSDKSDLSDSQKLFCFIKDRFLDPETSFYAKKELLVISEQWISNPYFNNGEVQDCQDQIKGLANLVFAQNSPTLNTLSKKLLDRLESTSHMSRQEPALTTGEEKALPDLVANLASGYLSSGSAEYEMAVKEVAISLKAESSQLFKAINSAEYKQAGWGKNPEQAPHLLRLIDNFNTLSKMVVCSILNPLNQLSADISPTTLEQRQQQSAKVMEFFIHVQKELLSSDDLVDLNSFMAIQSALKNAAVSRLTKTSVLLPQKLRPLITRFDNLTAADDNSKGLRGLMKTCQKPLIPYMGLLLSDITFSTEGNPSKIEGELNTDRIKIMARTINAIEKMQLKIEGFHLKPLYSFEEFPDDSWDYATNSFQWSLWIQPRPKG